MTEKKWERKEEDQEVQIHSMRDTAEKNLADSPDLKRQEPEDQPTIFPEVRHGWLKMDISKKLCLLLIPISLVLIAILAALNITTVYEVPLVLPVTNTVFIGVISLGIAYITTRVYTRSGTASVFLMGSGILIFGLGAITAGWLILLPGGPNINVTIYNTCAFVGSLFILTGAVISGLSPIQRRGSGSTWKGVAVYTGILVFVALFCLATVKGIVPPFFIPGIGFTVIRQVLLENAIVFYALASVLFLYTYLKGRTDFFFWYSISFALLSIGLFAFFIQPTVGSLMGWLGRSTNYGGFVFALYAVYIAQRAATAKDLPLEEIIANFFVDAEQSYKQLVETATDAIITFDEDYRVLLWNPAAERMFGYRRDEVIGLSFLERVIDERYLEVIKKEEGDFPASRKQPLGSVSVEIVGKRKDKTLIPVELTISRRWQNGRLIRTGILRDLTERKRAEEALYMSLVIDGVPTQLSYVDADLRYVYANKAYAEWYGRTINELKGKSIRDVKGEEIFLQDLPHYQMALSGKPVSFERIIPDTKGKDHFVIISLVPHYKDEWVTGFFASIIDITGRKVAEEALAKSFAIFKTVMDSLDSLVYVTDMETYEILFINQYGRKIWGDITGKICWESLQVDQKGPCQFCTNKKLLDSDGNPAGTLIWEFQNTVNGQWYECHDRAIQWPDGRIVRIEIASDITGRKQAEEALRQLSDRLSLAVRAGGVGIWDYDVVNNTLTWDDQMFALYGIKREPFGGAYEAWQAGLHPDDRLQGDVEIQMALRGEKEFDSAFRVLWPDGSIHSIRAFGIVQRDAVGKPLRMIGTNWDITERKMAEEALVRKHEELNAAYEQLTASEEELQVNYADLATSQSSLRETTNYLNNLLDYANAPIIVWDPSQRITRFNHAFERLTGRTSEEVLGQPLEILYPPQNREHLLELIEKTMSGERWETAEIPILHVNGSIRTVLWNSATLLAEDQTTVIATIAQGYDITERKIAKDALLRVNQKLNVITNLTRQDLTNQLFVLKSYLGMTKKNAAGQDRILDGIQKCETAILSISEITEFTKDFQDMGAKPPKWQNVNMVLLFGLSHISIGKIQHSLETEKLEIFADPLLEKVCQILFENSVKHGDHVTRIRVSHTGTPYGGTIFFEDDGVGILKEKKEQIFLRGEGPRASMRSLFFVREILDITGITIKETGEPGKGARFEIAVPKGAWRIANVQ